MRARVYNTLYFVGFLLLGFTATAFAAGEVTADASILDLARPVFDAVVTGQYWAAASLAVVLGVAAFKRYAPEGKARDFAYSDVGGAALVLLGSFGGALATGLLAIGTNAISIALCLAAIKIAFAAAGGYALVKKLVTPLLLKLQAKAPAWAQPFLGIALWLFVKPSPVVVAETAGQAAVDAKPAAGAASVVGKANEID